MRAASPGLNYRINSPCPVGLNIYLLVLPIDISGSGVWSAIKQIFELLNAKGRVFNYITTRWNRAVEKVSGTTKSNRVGCFGFFCILGIEKKAIN